MRDRQDAQPKKSTNPRKIALLGAAGTILAIIDMSSGGEAASRGVVILQYVFLACGLVGLFGGLVMMTTPQK
jgi:hypothetical protein